MLSASGTYCKYQFTLTEHQEPGRYTEFTIHSGDQSVLTQHKHLCSRDDCALVGHDSLFTVRGLACLVFAICVLFFSILDNGTVLAMKINNFRNYTIIVIGV